MIDLRKREILGVLVSVSDLEATVARVIDAAKECRPLGVSALAVHGVMTGALDRTHRHRLNALHIVVPDGQPVRWALNFLHGVNLRDRVRGPDLMLNVCASAAAQGLPVFFFGNTPAVLERLQARLSQRFSELRVAGAQPSRFRPMMEDEVLEQLAAINSSGAAIVFVGLGCPRQETWVYEHLGQLSMPMLAVGMAFDIHAGYLNEAPAWMQHRGLEWLYRLVKEPKRLWRRYLFLNPSYLALVGLQKLGLHLIRASHGRAPSDPVRWG